MGRCLPHIFFSILRRAAIWDQPSGQVEETHEGKPNTHFKPLLTSLPFISHGPMQTSHVAQPKVKEHGNILPLSGRKESHMAKVTEMSEQLDTNEPIYSTFFSKSWPCPRSWSTVGRGDLENMEPL